MIGYTKISGYLLAAVAVLFSSLVLFSGQPALADVGTNCSVGPIPLEIPIGVTGGSSTTGLTDYIIKVYQFIVGSIGIVSAAMIMFHGFRWAQAAGNSELITTSREGIFSALIGLMIALASYLLLFVLNNSLVKLPDICPTGLVFNGGVVAGGGCSKDADCESGLQCVPNAGDVVAADGTTGVCYSRTQRDNGTICNTASECKSGICNITAPNNNKCTSGDGLDGYVCVTEDECAAGYNCKNNPATGNITKICTAVVAGDRCNNSNKKDCGTTLYCVAQYEPDHCTDGSVGQQCDGPEDCALEYCGWVSPLYATCTTCASWQICDALLGTDSGQCQSGLTCSPLLDVCQ